jgi:hypothetical protein
MSGARTKVGFHHGAVAATNQNLFFTGCTSARLESAPMASASSSTLTPPPDLLCHLHARHDAEPSTIASVNAMTTNTNTNPTPRRTTFGSGLGHILSRIDPALPGRD